MYLCKGALFSSRMYRYMYHQILIAICFGKAKGITKEIFCKQSRVTLSVYHISFLSIRKVLDLATSVLLSCQSKVIFFFLLFCACVNCRIYGPDIEE